MNVASSSTQPTLIRRDATPVAWRAPWTRARSLQVAVHTGLVAATSGAFAQTSADLSTPGPTSRPAFLLVLAHLDALTVALIVAAVLVVALLVWRVATMVRREAPVPAGRGARSARERDDSLDRATDWGFDQNKRAALVRSPVTIANTTVDLPSLEHAVTQWSMTDLQRANQAGVQPEDTLGRAPTVAPSLYRTSFNPYFRHETPATSIEVVEVADALLQAELLVQLGDPKQAMTLLSKHIRETEKPGPAVWLMLLGLYQSTGREAQYNALGAGFKVLFNAEVPPWATTPDAMARELESYGTVIARLQSAWGGSEARIALDGLLRDDRGGSRQGFTLTAYRELIFLVEIVDTLDAMKADEEERHGIRRKLEPMV